MAVPPRENLGLIDAANDPVAEILGWGPRPALGVRKYREAAEVPRALWRILEMPDACVLMGDRLDPDTVCVVDSEEVVVLVLGLVGGSEGPFTRSRWDHVPAGIGPSA